MTEVVYLDASALVKLVADEAESDALHAYLSGRHGRATSIVGMIELQRGAARQGEIEPDVVDFVLGSLEAVSLDGQVVASAARLQPSGLRTLDAIHIASAIELGRDLDALVTYDRRMIAAARAAGLPVVSPGAA